MQQQVQSLPPPPSMPVPNKPNPLLLLLAGLAGSAGTALSKQNNFMPATIGAIQHRIEAPDLAREFNQQKMDKFDAQKQSILMELRLKKLDFAMQRAKQDDNQQAQAEIRSAQDQVKQNIAELNATTKLLGIEAQQKGATERKGMPNLNVSTSTRTTDVNYSGTGKGGAGYTSVTVSGPGGKGTQKITLLNPSQYFTRKAAIEKVDEKPEMKLPKLVELASKRQTDDTSMEDVVDRLFDLDPAWDEQPNAQAIKNRIQRAFNEVSAPAQAPTANKKTGKVQGSLIYR
jgi:hypothetical protein